MDDCSHIDKGKPFAEVEVMKMYITVTAAESGTIRLVCPEGTICQSGDLLAHLDLDDKDRYTSGGWCKGMHDLTFLPIWFLTTRTGSQRGHV